MERLRGEKLIDVVSRKLVNEAMGKEHTVTSGICQNTVDISFRGGNFIKKHFSLSCSLRSNIAFDIAIDLPMILILPFSSSSKFSTLRSLQYHTQPR
jgi:hypothetical protein